MSISNASYSQSTQVNSSVGQAVGMACDRGRVGWVSDVDQGVVQGVGSSQGQAGSVRGAINHSLCSSSSWSNFSDGMSTEVNVGVRQLVVCRQFASLLCSNTFVERKGSQRSLRWISRWISRCSNGDSFLRTIYASRSRIHVGNSGLRSLVLRISFQCYFAS